MNRKGKLLLDSANLDEIKDAVNTGTISGVTTNPSLFAKENVEDYVTHIKKIVNLIKTIEKPHLSVEVFTTDKNKFRDIAEEAYDMNSTLIRYCEIAHGNFGKDIDLYIKIPMGFEYLKVIEMLKSANVKVNATACMTEAQAVMAEFAGADVISFFYNRMKDYEKSLAQNIAEYNSYVEIANYCFRKNSNSKVICGSIRTVNDVFICWGAGADYVTVPLKILKEMCEHPKTDEAIRLFNKDVEEWKKIKKSTT